MARHLHQKRLTGGEPLDLPQERRAIGGGEEHPALPLDRPLRHGAIDRAETRRIAAIDQQIGKPPAIHQGRRFAPFIMIEDNRVVRHVPLFQMG